MFGTCKIYPTYLHTYGKISLHYSVFSNQLKITSPGVIVFSKCTLKIMIEYIILGRRVKYEMCVGRALTLGSYFLPLDRIADWISSHMAFLWWFLRVFPDRVQPTTLSTISKEKYRKYNSELEILSIHRQCYKIKWEWCDSDTRAIMNWRKKNCMNNI